MKEVTIQLTEKQERFLKLFAEKHKEGSKDNHYTYKPIHLVQSVEYDYIPYSTDIEDYDLGEIVFTSDSDCEYWYEDEVELIKDWYDDQGEEDTPNIKPFSELYLQDVVGVDGKKRFIVSFEDYFQTYGVKVYGIAFRKERWKTVAYFFILEEAKRYIEYQSHNLRKPRTYSVSMGYANYGEYEHFYDILMNIGTILNNESINGGSLE